MYPSANSSPNVAYLVNQICPWPYAAHIYTTGLCADSRLIKVGQLFIAYTTAEEKRVAFMIEAVVGGAIGILIEADNNQEASYSLQKIAGQLVPIGKIVNLKQHIGQIAARFYNNPADSLRFIGITGTNGKTSCTQFIAYLLQKSGIKCGTIGTLGEGFPDAIIPGQLTTPEPLALHAAFNRFKAKNTKWIAMEVSSHSLVQHRVKDIPFETAVFTNITHDHLDYHGDMKRYKQAKRLLFMSPGLKKAVINADDFFGKRLLAEFKQQLACYAFTLKKNMKLGDIPLTYAYNIRLNSDGFSLSIDSPWGQGDVKTSLMGAFNISNLLATLSTVCLCGIPFSDVLTKLSKLPTVPGRMQRLGGLQQPLCIVDYAHTPDALQKVLLTLRMHCQQTLWCVFGCGGDRDKDKRPLMAQTAEYYSDKIIITDDNPRLEDPQLIVEDICKGFVNPQKVIILHNRQQAIQYAIQQARVGDIVLIAGKGHEIYQELGDQRLPFSDVNVIQACLADKTNLSYYA